MSNALAGFLETEWLKFKAWLSKEHTSVKEEVAKLRKEVEALKAKLP